MPRIARTGIQLRREIRWLIAKVESTHCVLFIKKVAYPQLDDPVFAFETGARIDQLIGLRFLVMRNVKIIFIARRGIQPRKEATPAAVNRPRGK